MDPIFAIKLDQAHTGYLNALNEPLTTFPELGRVNILVGANNSGKSRFLRRLACSGEYAVHRGEDLTVKLAESIRTLLLETSRSLESKGVTRHGEISRSGLSDLASRVPVGPPLGRVLVEELRATFMAMSKAQRDDPTTYDLEPINPSPKHVARELNGVAARGAKLFEAEEHKLKPERVYIPTLRGLRPLGEESQRLNGSAPDYYLDRTRADYFKNEQSPPVVFTGMTLYSAIRKLLLGLSRGRQRAAEFQRFLSAEFFDNREVTLVPHDENDVLYVKIGREADHPIYELGDGIQQAIVLSFLPFTATQDTFFFIEELEQHMHPGLQRKVLRFFAEKCQRHHFFITSHSNHLLDMTADFSSVAVFNIRKRLGDSANPDDDEQPSFVVQPLDTGDRSVLEDLGVRNSSVFLVNATIWVEGVTDRLYLRRFLELYQEHRAKTDKMLLRVQEDVHFAIVEYGGGNVTHFFIDEADSPSITLDRVCGKVFLLIDEDGAKKQERKKRLEERVGGHYAITPGREIENLLPIEVVYAVVSDFEQKNGGTLPALAAEPKPHRDVPLGEYIHTQFFNADGWKRKGGYCADSGTIKGKVDFCHRAIEKLTAFEELSEEVQQLVGRIYEFVVKQNT
jgi:hypothetical protein